MMLILSVCASGARGQDAVGLSLVPAVGLYPDRITATGRVVPLTSARLGPRVSSHLVEFGKDAQGRVLDVGMTVKEGDVLFRLDPTKFDTALAMSQATLNSAKASFENLTAKTREERLEELRQTVAELDVRIADRQRDQERFKRLVEEEKTLPVRRLEEVQTEVGVLQAQRKAADARLREAENGPTPTEIAVAQARVQEATAAMKMAQDDLRDATTRAPFGGLITRRFKSIGDYITSTPPTDVLELVSIDRLEAELRLPEAALASVVAGQTPVILRSPLLKGELKAPVSRVIADIDTLNGTFAVRVGIPAEQRGALVPGAFITGELTTAQDSAVVVPIRAVVEGAGKPAVFVPENGTMRRQDVVLGDRLTEGIIVQSGLAAGEKVVVGPASLLRDGAALPADLLDRPGASSLPSTRPSAGN